MPADPSLEQLAFLRGGVQLPGPDGSWAGWQYLT
jgi:hypothetical protein